MLLGQRRIFVNKATFKTWNRVRPEMFCRDLKHQIHLKCAKLFVLHDPDFFFFFSSEDD